MRTRDKMWVNNHAYLILGKIEMFEFSILLCYLVVNNSSGCLGTVLSKRLAASHM